MAYEMVMPYHLHMPSYFLETFTEYPCRSALAGNYKNAGYILFLILDKIRKRLLSGRHKKMCLKNWAAFYDRVTSGTFFLVYSCLFLFLLSFFRPFFSSLLFQFRGESLCFFHACVFVFG